MLDGTVRILHSMNTLGGISGILIISDANTPEAASTHGRKYNRALCRLVVAVTNTMVDMTWRAQLSQ